MNSSELKGYLTGLILGDGTIDKGVKKRSFRIKSINKEFIDKIEKDLKDTNTFKITVQDYPEYVGKDGTHHKEYYQIFISAHPYFAKKYPYFYDDYRNRRITNETLSWLNIQGIANWWMSDGYICLVGKTKGKVYNRRVELCTDRYSLEDVKKIQQYFADKWGWETTIKQRKQSNKIFYRLYFKISTAQDFLMKIYPYIVPSFYYKLDMGYDEQNQYVTNEYFDFMKKIRKCEQLDNQD